MTRGVSEEGNSDPPRASPVCHSWARASILSTTRCKAQIEMSGSYPFRNVRFSDEEKGLPEPYLATLPRVRRG
jgi:hypothetical protein